MSQFWSRNGVSSMRHASSKSVMVLRIFFFFIWRLVWFINRLFRARWQNCTHSKMWKKNGDELSALSQGVGKKWSQTLFAHCAERKNGWKCFSFAHARFEAQNYFSSLCMQIYWTSAWAWIAKRWLAIKLDYFFIKIKSRLMQIFHCEIQRNI